MRITSLRSNGFASTSYAPMFRASAHSCSSASREVTIRNGGLGKSANCASNSCHVPGAKSHSQTTIGILLSRKMVSADASVQLLQIVRLELRQRVHSE